MPETPGYHGRCPRHPTRRGASLLVCAVIAILFLSAFLNFDAAMAVSLLFIAAMLAFFLGLLSFVREIYVETVTLRIGPRETGA